MRVASSSSALSSSSLGGRAARAATAPPPPAPAGRQTLLVLAPCSFPAPQGTPVFIRAHANLLAAAGHRVHLLSYPSTAPAGAGDGFVWHRAHGRPPSDRSGPHPRRLSADLCLARAALALARQLRPAALWAHQPEGLAIGLWLRARLGIPVVFHSHAMLAEELPTYVAYGRPLFAALGAAVDAALPRHADATVCFEEGHARALRAAGVAPERLHVIPPGLLPWPPAGHGVDLADAWAETPRPCPAPRFSAVRAHKAQQVHSAYRAPTVLSTSRPRLLYSGNFDGYQNLHLLLAALPHVRRALPAATLLLAAHHPVRQRRLPPGAVMHQVHDLAEMARLLAGADLAICPRTLHAGAPIKLLNSRAAGLPVVTCCPAARSLLDPAGTTISRATPRALAAAIVGTWCATAGKRQPSTVPAIPAYLGAYERVLARAREGKPSERDGGALRAGALVATVPPAVSAVR